MIIYTDGAYSPSRDQGGWAFFIEDQQLPVTAGVKNTTNNRMELEAIKQALEYVLRADVKEDIVIYTDSMYCVGVLTKNWTRNKNQDIIETIDSIKGSLDKKKVKVTITHVKGHNDNEGNEFVDKLANHSSIMLCQFLAKRSTNVKTHYRHEPYKSTKLVL